MYEIGVFVIVGTHAVRSIYILCTLSSGFLLFVYSNFMVYFLKYIYYVASVRSSPTLTNIYDPHCEQTDRRGTAPVDIILDEYNIMQYII